jgi:hypothetical protein
LVLGNIRDALETKANGSPPGNHISKVPMTAANVELDILNFSILYRHDHSWFWRGLLFLGQLLVKFLNFSIHYFQCV